MVYVIGIAGGTGSGKTTIANELASSLNPEDITYVAFDNYYRDLSHLPKKEREKTNFDHPDSLEVELLISHLKSLKNQKEVKQPLYNFKTHARKQKTKTLSPTPIIILEGILTLAYPKLLPLLDFKIFVDTEPDIRFIRRLQRDLNERGRTLEGVIQQYHETVRPMHIEFVEPSKREADIIIPEGRNPAAQETLIRSLKQRLKELSTSTTN